MGWPKFQLPTLGAPSPPLPAVTVLGSPTRLLCCQELLQAHLQPEISTSRRHPSTAGLQKALGNLLVEAESTPTEHKRQCLGPPGGVSATGDGTWRQLFRLQLLQLQKHLQKKHGEVRAQLWAAGREELVRSAWAPRPGRQSGRHGARGTRQGPESLTYLAPGSRRRRGPKISPRARGWRLLLSACCDTFPRCRSRNCRVSVFWSGTAGDSRASSSCFRQFSGWGTSGERSKTRWGGLGQPAPRSTRWQPRGGSAGSSRGRVRDPIGTGSVLTTQTHPSHPRPRSQAWPGRPLPCRTRRMSPCTATGTTGEGRSCR